MIEPLTEEELAEIEQDWTARGFPPEHDVLRLVADVPASRAQSAELKRLGEKAFAGWVDTALRRETP